MNEADRSNYPELMEEWHEFNLYLPMLHKALMDKDTETCLKVIPKFKYNWINIQDKDDNSFLHLAAINGANEEICNLLIDKMNIITINVQNGNKLTAYQEAKSRGFDYICKLLEDKTLEAGKQ